MTLPFAPTTPVYGGDYNPEQWDAATIRDDIELMREAGVNLVSLGIFSWARMEPTEGHYDLDWVGDLIDRLHAAGISVDLATGTASPPAWMAQNYPETLPMTEDGVRLGFGSRQQYCPSSPVYREKSAALAAELAKRFGRHPGVVLWHIGNEYGCHIHECFCPECTEEFRTWLIKRHGDIEGVNHAWGTDFWSQHYTDISQVTPPAAMPTFKNPGQLLNWRRFSNHQILGCLLGELEQIRRYSDRPITTNFMGSFPWLDYREWAQHLDVITDDSYPEPSNVASANEVAWQADLMRGLAAGKPWFLMEQTTSEVQWRVRNGSKRPGQYKLWSLGRLAHGAEGVLQFQWRQSIKGSETFHAGMVPHAGRDSATWGEVVDLGQSLQKLGPIVGQPIESKVAIILDWESEWATMCSTGPQDWSHFRDARAWHRTLWEQGISTDIVGKEDTLSGYALVIVPSLLVDDPAFTVKVREAVEAGTQVLVTAPSGVVTPDMEARQGGYLGSWRDLLGVKVTDWYGLTAGVYEREMTGVERVTSAENDARDALVNRMTRAIGAPAALDHLDLAIESDALDRARNRLLTVTSPDVSIRPSLRGSLWGERVLVTPVDESEVEVLATFANSGGSVDLAGLPAFTRHAVGEGAAWYLATDADAFTRAVILQLVTAYGRIQPIYADLPDGVEAGRRGPFLFLLNHSDRAVEMPGITGVELLTGDRATGHIVLSPRSGAVVDTSA